MTIQHVQAAAAQQGAESADVVTLSGENIFAFSFGSNATAQVDIDNDGNMYRRLNGGAQEQIDSSTDWIVPESSAPGSYRVRYTNKTGVAFLFNNIGSENVYAALTTTRSLSVRDTSGAPGGVQATFDLEIDDGSVSQDTGAYLLNAEREDF